MKLNFINNAPLGNKKHNVQSAGNLLNLYFYIVKKPKRPNCVYILTYQLWVIRITFFCPNTASYSGSANPLISPNFNFLNGMGYLLLRLSVKNFCIGKK